MKRLELKPEGFPCKLSECPPGFFLFNDGVCFKSQYGNDHDGQDVFLEGGCSFWGGKDADRPNLIVQPLVSNWTTNE